MLNSRQEHTITLSEHNSYANIRKYISWIWLVLNSGRKRFFIVPVEICFLCSDNVIVCSYLEFSINPFSDCQNTQCCKSYYNLKTSRRLSALWKKMCRLSFFDTRRVVWEENNCAVLLWLGWFRPKTLLFHTYILLVPTSSTRRTFYFQTKMMETQQSFDN